MAVNMKNIIAEALVSMLRKKNADKITVKALIEVCGISRQTFYYHFRDITDVIEYSLRQAVQDMLSRSLAAGTPEQALHVFVSSTVENYTLIQKLMRSQRREEMEKMLLESARSYLKELLHARIPDLSLNYADLELMLDFCACGLTGTLLKYCSHDFTDTEQLTHRLFRLISGQMTDLPLL